MKFALLIFLFFFATSLYGQSSTFGDWQDDLRSWMTAEDIEEDYGEETMELLAEQAAAKINLNQTSREELEQLPFLTAQQVEGIVEYLHRYVPMRSLSELQMITSLDWHTRRLLSHFVYVGESKGKRVWPKFSDVVKYGRQSLMATAKFPFYDRKGDRNGYLGYKYRHDVRYRFTYNDRIKFGLTAAQDAGEPFLANRNSMGYDHYSYYVQLRKMGRLEALNLGMYRVQLGLGLIANTGFHLGKLATLQSLGRSTHALTAHASRSATGYMQGAAATIRLSNRWRVTGFASYRPLDATLNADSTARTLLTDGYHRTPTEMEKKHNTHETDLGLSVGYRQGTFHVAANAVTTHLDRPLQPQQSALYRRYAAAGSSFFNASLDYGYNNHRMSIAGETAVNRDGALALLHTLSCKVADDLSLMLLHRYYDKRYTTLHGQSFSEGTSVQNEHGIYFGVTWRPTRSWLVQGYADYAHFDWPRYQVTAPSDAFDALLLARVIIKRWTLESRYRFHLRQRDSADKRLLQNRPEHRLRLRATLELSRQLTLQTQADGISVRQSGGGSLGLMLGQHVRWQCRWLQLDGQAAWFHTDDYDSRLYQYERSVAYDFSFPMYYGHGLHYSLMASAHLGRRLMATGKFSVTDYFDRNTIGSGLQLIDRSSQPDLLVQVRYQW